jgi:hypothetical protein
MTSGSIAPAADVVQKVILWQKRDGDPPMLLKESHARAP